MPQRTVKQAPVQAESCALSSAAFLGDESPLGLTCNDCEEPSTLCLFVGGMLRI